ncbi:hypothetical protein GE21DRAFT_1241946, partial [Neurospora crassa]
MASHPLLGRGCIRRVKSKPAFSSHRSGSSNQALATFSKKNDPRVAIGLRYMHQKGFLHRDLKPLNILVDTPGPGWKVKLADFGIARNIAGPTLPIHPLHCHRILHVYGRSRPLSQPQHLLQYRAGMRPMLSPSQVLALSTGFFALTSSWKLCMLRTRSKDWTWRTRSWITSGYVSMERT